MTKVSLWYGPHGDTINTYLLCYILSEWQQKNLVAWPEEIISWLMLLLLQSTTWRTQQQKVARYFSACRPIQINPKINCSVRSNIHLWQLVFLFYLHYSIDKALITNVVNVPTLMTKSNNECKLHLQAIISLECIALVHSAAINLRKK